MCTHTHMTFIPVGKIEPAKNRNGDAMKASRQHCACQAGASCRLPSGSVQASWKAEAVPDRGQRAAVSTGVWTWSSAQCMQGAGCRALLECGV